MDYIKQMMLHDLTEETAERLTELVGQLSDKGRVVTLDDLNDIYLNNPKTTLWLARDGDHGPIIGTITLVIPVQLCAGKAWAEDLVVDSEYRREGVARSLMLTLIHRARELHIKKLYATTSRPPSLALCDSLEFERRDSTLVKRDLG